MTNGERMKFLREKRGYTQKEVAIKLGLEPAAISKYELDMREPNIESIIKLSELYGVSIDYLLGRTLDFTISKEGKIKIDLQKYINSDKYKRLMQCDDEAVYYYKNLEPLIVVCNEMCSGVGWVSYGYSKTSDKVDLLTQMRILSGEKNDFVLPQMQLELKELEETIIIVEMDQKGDSNIIYTAKERIEIYMSKLSKKYNVFGIAVNVEEDERCRVTDTIYMRKNEDTYIRLELPKRLLVALDYIDILKRIDL